MQRSQQSFARAAADSALRTSRSFARSPAKSSNLRPTRPMQRRHRSTCDVDTAAGAVEFCAGCWAGPCQLQQRQEERQRSNPDLQPMLVWSRRRWQDRQHRSLPHSYGTLQFYGLNTACHGCLNALAVACDSSRRAVVAPVSMLCLVHHCTTTRGANRSWGTERFILQSPSCKAPAGNC